MPITPDTLEQIANRILLKLKAASTLESERLLQMNDYHGFLKARMPQDFLDEILSPYQLTEENVQIEIVKVETDLSNEIHYHENSYAHIVCLGQEYKTEDPKLATAFIENAWVTVRAGYVIRIPPKTPHGFTVDDGGVLVFLSVQAPPIERDGNDDYHRVSER
ncbi:MAG: hypothetical protein JWN49_686 [Parcubacteria group bacterium]|nr:hypothetical protein [Parcubacteria group bacterium]